MTGSRCPLSQYDNERWDANRWFCIGDKANCIDSVIQVLTGSYTCSGFLRCIIVYASVSTSGSLKRLWWVHSEAGRSPPHNLFTALFLTNCVMACLLEFCKETPHRFFCILSTGIADIHSSLFFVCLLHSHCELRCIFHLVYLTPQKSHI